jgi:hypothetical protein
MGSAALRVVSPCLALPTMQVQSLLMLRSSFLGGGLSSASFPFTFSLVSAAAATTAAATAPSRKCPA